MPAKKDAIRVRMYRVGFGDCFLVTLPGGGAEDRHLLVDCGVHPSGDLRTMGQAVADVREATGGRLAAVIATHEHADHISGFGSEAPAFARMQVGEIWMPWAMDPDDPVAAALRKARLAFAAHLAAHFSAAGAAEALAVVLNATRNEDAMRALRTRFDGAAQRIRYLKAGDRLAGDRPRPGAAGQTGAAGVEGLVVEVLGPPTDPEFLKKMDPPKSQRYLRATAGGEAGEALQAFPKDLRAPRARGRKAFGLSRKDAPELEADLKKSLGESMEELAFTLDSAVNNTSLVLALNFRGQTLLFPGDAQWGNWKFWLDAPSTQPLLDRLAFLKVAHHGSHNATPRRALEAMPEGLAAMVSTQSRPWPSIPRPPLLDALAKKTKGRLVRSDSLVDAPGVPASAPQGPKLTTLPKGFAKGKLWYDYTLPL